MVGIDLGTTNIVVAYSEISDDLKSSPVNVFEIDQLIGAGEIAKRSSLPAFRFHPAQNQFQYNELTLPWDHSTVDGDISNPIIGYWARELGSKIEGRQVSSAKSWLSHNKVDRESEILPWGTSDEIERVSPVVASASYLNYIRECWNHYHPIHLLEHQSIVITVPASFDETARNLTLKAAALAGLNDCVLLEEPQAACYDWYARYEHEAKSLLEHHRNMLVVDVGGGTTDLSLIKANIHNDELTLDRIGVGEHLMLGGDNIDLALAHMAEQKLNNSKPLTTAALAKLIQQTRTAKEQLLANNAPESANITVLGSGSRLLAASQKAVLSKQEVHALAVDGFFPITNFTEKPDKRRSAVVEFGLPYVADPAISKHIAEFLESHQESLRTSIRATNPSSFEVPSALLLNGGAFNSPILIKQVQKLLHSWGQHELVTLDNPSPDNAVALGAVEFNKAKRGARIKIGGGSPRSYFLHLPDKKGLGRAICLLAKGAQEGESFRLSSRKFSLTLNEPVQFQFLASNHDSIRQTQIQNGMMCEVNTEEFTPLSPVIAHLEKSTEQSLQTNQKLRATIQLELQYTELGTLNINCVDIDNGEKWKIEFDLRAINQSVESVKEDPQLIKATALISKLYSANKNQDENINIKSLNRDLERILGKRETWDHAVLRAVFDTLVLGKKRRRRSQKHEENWLRYAGFGLRPGYGSTTDEWRLRQLWDLYQQGLQFPSAQQWSEWWILWRRVSGGLDQQQQEKLLADTAKYLHPGIINRNKVSTMASDNGYEAMVRLVATLEELDTEDKKLLCQWFSSRGFKMSQFQQAHWWAVARLGARQLVSASQHKVIQPDYIEPLLVKMLELDWRKEPSIAFAAVMLCRKTGDRSIDVEAPIQNSVIEKLKTIRASDSWIQLVQEVSELSEQDQKKVYGETVPQGLFLI
jgi:molecular chaperone DnaK (HSP70)